MLKFDLGSPVNEVCWAPYSSTLFACVTADGDIYVYDIGVNKYEPICVQRVSEKKTRKLTRIAFNHENFMIVVGDDRWASNQFDFLLRITPTKPHHLNECCVQQRKCLQP